ncbi:MAG: NAD(P)/FAD-dependent oxidoreductase [Bacteroidota bacterium]
MPTSYDFDLLVIGSGPAGSSVAQQCAKAGWKVGVADYQFGGTCAQTGCTPKKLMEVVTSTYWKAQHLHGKGFRQPLVPLDWGQLRSHAAQTTALIPVATKRDFSDAGIVVIEAKVAFKDKYTLVDQVQDREWTAERIVIATGARPTPLEFSGAEHLISHEVVFSLSALPQRVVLVGGGYIAFEFSHILAACGAQVTIISDAEMPLSQADPDMVQQLIKATLDKGVDLRLGYEAEAVRRENDFFQVDISQAHERNPATIPADLVVHCAGRVPQLATLHLDKTGIQYDDNGIKVNGHLQCQGAENIYALGDVIGEQPFTPAATYEADTLVHNLLRDTKQEVDYTGLPTVVYTYPKMASVGQTAEQLDAAKVDYKTIQRDLKDDLLENGANNAYAGYKVFVTEDEKQLLGAHVISTRAEEIVNLLAVAMQCELELQAVENLLLAYPSASQAAKHMLS